MTQIKRVSSKCNGAIVVRLFGGLGNQLFQYAASRHLSISSNLPLMLDTHNGFTRDPYKRQYALDMFRIKGEVADNRIIPVFARTGWPVFGLWLRFQVLLPEKRRSVFLEKELFRYDSSISKQKRPVYLVGYWQSYKYFREIAELIKEEIVLKNGFCNAAQGIAHDICRDSSSVSVHIRKMHSFGANNRPAKRSFYEESFSMEYYHDAIRVISKRIKNPRLFIFSDNPEWCRANLSIPFRYNIISGDPRISDSEELILMSLCSHHIISNSTYAYWGAWLKANAKDTVIAPGKWIQDSTINLDDLFPPDWIVM